MVETVRLLIEDFPANIYEALEYICNVDPKEDLKDYIIRTLRGDVVCMMDSDWAETMCHHNEKLKEILDGP